MNQNNSSFSSKLGYVLAAAGSAVGLGNIWRFPYLCAKNGGGIFLLIYIIFMLTFGYALLICENAIGRMTRKGPIGAYKECCQGKGWRGKLIGIGGYLNALAPLIIVPYYCVIGGWVTKYAVTVCTKSVSVFSPENKGFSAEFFGNFISNSLDSTAYFLIFVAILVIVVALGVEKGIERSSKILMPLLVLVCLCLCIYCCFLPNAVDGIVYFLKPDIHKFTYMTIVDGIGQLFYSLSLAMGIMITYGSYMRKEDNLVSNVNQVSIFDTGMAILAGMMIIPAAVAFGGVEAASKTGPGLIFITIPQVFASFRGGQATAILFFALVLFAAATSAISLLETNVQTMSQELKISRKNAITLGVLEILVVGVVVILGYSVLKEIHPLAFIEMFKECDILDSLDTVANNILLPIGAIFTTLLVCFVISVKKICEEIHGSDDAPRFKWPRKKIFVFSIRYFVIPCLIIILLSAFGIIHS